MGMVTEILSFYTPYADISRMEQAISTVLREQIVLMQRNGQSFYVELRDGQYVRIPFLSAESDRLTFQKQIQILYSCTQKLPCEDPYIKQNLLYQIALFRAAYVLTFNYEKSERNERILPLMEIADQMDALIFWESGDISDSYGDVILNKQGRSEVTVFNPVDGFDITNKALGLNETVMKRIYHSLSVLRYKGIYAPTNIAPPFDDKLRILQDEESICQRAIACMMLGTYTQLLMSTNGDSVQAYRSMEEMIHMYQASSYFTVHEIEYLNDRNPNRMDVGEYEHYFECAYVLLWMLGLYTTLYFPSAFCAKETVMKAIFHYASAGKMAKKAKLRKKGALLNAMDLNQRYVWACRDAQKLGFAMPQGLCHEVVRMRHHAFHWVVGRQEIGWDEVHPKIASLKLKGSDFLK